MQNFNLMREAQTLNSAPICLICLCTGCCVCKVCVSVCLRSFPTLAFQKAPGSIPTLHLCISADWLRPWSPLLLEQCSHRWRWPWPATPGWVRGTTAISALHSRCQGDDPPAHMTGQIAFVPVLSLSSSPHLHPRRLFPLSDTLAAWRVGHKTP